MKKSPTLPRRDETRGEDDSMEGNVVLSHELVELYFVVVPPPLRVVLLQEVGGDRNIANRRIEPNIEHLLFELLERQRDSPFQVSSYTLWLKPHVGPGLSDCDGVICPVSFFGGNINPFFKFRLYLRQVDEEMHSGLDFWSFLAEEAEVVDHFGGRVEGFLAFVALITTSIGELAEGASSNNEPIR